LCHGITHLLQWRTFVRPTSIYCLPRSWVLRHSVGYIVPTAIQYTDSKPVPPYHDVLFMAILLSFNDVDTSKSIATDLFPLHWTQSRSASRGDKVLVIESWEAQMSQRTRKESKRWCDLPPCTAPVTCMREESVGTRQIREISISWAPAWLPRS